MSYEAVGLAKMSGDASPNDPGREMERAAAW